MPLICEGGGQFVSSTLLPSRWFFPYCGTILGGYMASEASDGSAVPRDGVVSTASMVARDGQ